LLNYHLYNPYAYLHHRLHFDLAPAGLQTYFNPFLDLAYFSALSVLTPKSVGFLIGLLQGLSFVVVYEIAGQVLGKEREGHALFLGMTGLLSVGFLSEVGTTFNDSLVGVISLASLWLAMLAVGYIDQKSKQAVALIGVSGLLAGIGSGLKLTVSIYALALFLGLFLVPIARNCRLAFLFGVSAVAGLLLSDGYWLYKMWREFGNPLFPQFNDIFHGELARFDPVRDTRFVPRNLYEKLFYPILFTINPLRVGELRYEQVSWVFAYVALPALVVAAFIRASKKDPDRQFSPKAVLFLAFFGIGYLLWLNIFGIYRYIVPLEILIPLLLFLFFDHFFKPEVARRRAVVFISIITLTNLLIGEPDWGHTSWSDSVYRVEPSAISTPPEPAAIYLVGQPLAWIVPALDLHVPVIQLAPNMPVSKAYWQRAKAMVENRPGRRFVIFESTSPALMSRGSTRLAKLGLAPDEGACDRLIGYLGSEKREYRFCGVKPLEMTQ